MPVRWPDGWPNNTLKAMRAADLRSVDWPRGRLLARRVPPGVCRRQGSLRRRQRPHRRRRLRASSRTPSSRPSRRSPSRTSFERPPPRRTSAACAAFRRSPSATSSSTATIASRRPLPPWPLRSLRECGSSGLRSRAAGAGSAVWDRRRLGVGRRRCTRPGVPAQARAAAGSLAIRGTWCHPPSRGNWLLNRQWMGTLRANGYE